MSFLTFLGIGVEPPTPTWGGILSSDLNYLAQAPLAPFIPGAVIAFTVGALNALADAVRDHVPAHQLSVISDASVPSPRPPMPTSSPADRRDPGRARRRPARRRGPVVSVQDGARTAVRDVSLRVGRGETVGLVGESGSGKTLTCRAMLGVLPAGVHVWSRAG